MENFIIIAVVVIILALAIFYIYKSKKSGKKCIGCPHSCNCCNKNNSGACGCSQNFNEE